MLKEVVRSFNRECTDTETGAVEIIWTDIAQQFSNKGTLKVHFLDLNISWH